jgi:hypothetical protein
MQIPIPYEPVEGKTYSLFGMDNSTSGYYQIIRELSISVLEKYNDPKKIIEIIQNYSRRKRRLRRMASSREHTDFISTVVHLLNTHLAGYTRNVKAHLKHLPIRKRWSRALSTTREQYHLYMLEIELSNQVNIERFLNAGKKIALLPHCLRDLDAECKSAPDDFDYQCKFCSKNCYQHYISRLLKKYDIDAYIWMGADLKKYARKIFMGHQSLAILGIACVPELVFGIRKCQKYHIPAIGIPLDANRCIRWMGKFHKNSVNLDQLERLLQTVI